MGYVMCTHALQVAYLYSLISGPRRAPVTVRLEEKLISQPASYWVQHHGQSRAEADRSAVFSFFRAADRTSDTVEPNYLPPCSLFIPATQQQGWSHYLQQQPRQEKNPYVIAPSVKGNAKFGLLGHANIMMFSKGLQGKKKINKSYVVNGCQSCNQVAGSDRNTTGLMFQINLFSDDLSGNKQIFNM